MNTPKTPEARILHPTTTTSRVIVEDATIGNDKREPKWYEAERRTELAATPTGYRIQRPR